MRLCALAAVLSFAALIVSGCTSFETERSSRFVDESGDMVGVEYAHCEERDIPFVAPNGKTLAYKSKNAVRVTLPDGTDFTAYRNMSLAGILYKTLDGEWEYFEEGAACAVAQMDTDGKGYLLRFQGVLCMNEKVKEKKPKIVGSSTPHGFGRPSSGPPDSGKSRTMERK